MASAQHVAYGVQGVKNLGNSCYQSCVLHCLGHCPPLMATVQQQLTTVDAGGEDMRTQLMLFLRSYWTATRTINPRSFYRACGKKRASFGNHTQQDAAEFLHLLIDEGVLVDDVKSVWMSHSNCKGCHYTSESDQDEEWRIVAVPLLDDQPLQLERCIDALMADRTVELNHSAGAGCAVSTITRRWRCTWRTSVLILQLGRFDDAGQKSAVQLTIPTRSKLLVLPKQLDKTYALFGVVHHHGQTANGGHYTAAVRHRVTGEWHLYDDGKVSEYTMASTEVSTTAYILFYCDTAVDWPALDPQLFVAAVPQPAAPNAGGRRSGGDTASQRILPGGDRALKQFDQNRAQYEDIAKLILPPGVSAADTANGFKFQTLWMLYHSLSQHYNKLHLEQFKLSEEIVDDASIVKICPAGTRTMIMLQYKYYANGLNFAHVSHQMFEWLIYVDANQANFQHWAFSFYCTAAIHKETSDIIDDVVELFTPGFKRDVPVNADTHWYDYRVLHAHCQRAWRLPGPVDSPRWRWFADMTDPSVLDHVYWRVVRVQLLMASSSNKNKKTSKPKGEPSTATGSKVENDEWTAWYKDVATLLGLHKALTKGWDKVIGLVRPSAIEKHQAKLSSDLQLFKDLYSRSWAHIPETTDLHSHRQRRMGVLADLPRLIWLLNRCFLRPGGSKWSELRGHIRSIVADQLPPKMRIPIQRRDEAVTYIYASLYEVFSAMTDKSMCDADLVRRSMDNEEFEQRYIKLVKEAEAQQWVQTTLDRYEMLDEAISKQDRLAVRAYIKVAEETAQDVLDAADDDLDEEVFALAISGLSGRLTRVYGYLPVPHPGRAQQNRVLRVSLEKLAQLIGTCQLDDDGTALANDIRTDLEKLVVGKQWKQKEQRAEAAAVWTAAVAGGAADSMDESEAMLTDSGDERFEWSVESLIAASLLC